MTTAAAAELDVSAMGIGPSVVVTLDDSSSKSPTLVWNQIAECGKFSGHPAGDFELSPAVFAQICANFTRDKLPVPIDMEHASEQEATAGTIPTQGAPAIGWIHQLDNRGQAGLWGQVEWLEPAKTYIKEGKYKYISPAIRFESRDRVTGQPIGARLTSAGLTNQPFLRNMQPLVARDGASTRVYCMSTSTTPNKIEKGLEVTVHEPPAEEEPEIHAKMAHSPSQYMAKVRAALKMPDLSSAKECADKLEKLRDMHAEHGAKTPDGVDMSDYMRSMRTLTGVGVGGTWENVFDLMEDLIDAALDKHEIEDHGAGPALAATDKPEVEEEDDDRSGEPKMKLATDKGAAATKTTTKNVPAAPVKPAEEIIMMDDNGLVIALRDANGQIGGLTLELKDTKHKLAVAEAEAEHLKTVLQSRDEQDLMNEVHVAFETYKDKKSLTAKDRPHMMSFAKSNPEAFRAMYPVVPAGQRYLMRDVAPPAPKANADLMSSSDGSPLSLSDLTNKLMSEKKLPFASAQNEAVHLMRVASNARGL